MFPGVDGFHWTVGHVIFLSLFFAVAITIAVTFGSAAWRTYRDFQTHRAAEFCWKSDFSELSEADRTCRHQLAGRVQSRTCDNSFDCRRCTNYTHFALLPGSENKLVSGLRYPSDRLYHRGHTWVKAQEDGTVVIGLDDLAEHLIGKPDSFVLPEIGSELELNQTAWRMKKGRQEIRVRAPMEGKVVESGGPEAGWFLKIRPRLDLTDPISTRHLLSGPEVGGWITRELERLQLQLQRGETAPALADGGLMLPNLMETLPDADWDAVLSDTFLEV